MKKFGLILLVLLVVVGWGAAGTGWVIANNRGVELVETQSNLRSVRVDVSTLEDRVFENALKANWAYLGLVAYLGVTDVRRSMSYRYNVNSTLLPSERFDDLAESANIFYRISPPGNSAVSEDIAQKIRKIASDMRGWRGSSSYLSRIDAQIIEIEDIVFKMKETGIPKVDKTYQGDSGSIGNIQSGGDEDKFTAPPMLTAP